MRRILFVVMCSAVACGNSSSTNGDAATPDDLLDLAASSMDDLVMLPDLAKKAFPDLSPVITQGEPAGLYGITYAHNQARADAIPAPSPALPALAWSTPIATAAQAWSDKCMYLHSSNGYGENLFASGGSVPTGDSIVQSWTDEASGYNYTTNMCSGACGHYEQVVARSTVNLGCGITICNTNSPFSRFPQWTLVVCDYDPPGGNDGNRPY